MGEGDDAINVAIVQEVRDKLQLALKLIDGDDLSSRVARQHLEESRTLLATLASVGSDQFQIEFPIVVWFRTTQSDNWIQGELHKDATVRFAGVQYSSPSDAARTLAGNNRNGWRNIYYDDPQSGNRIPIDNLRAIGLFKSKERQVISVKRWR